MKSISLCLLCAAAFSGFQSEAQSMLRVHLSDNDPITVSVDGRYFNRRGSSVTVGDLPYGNHTLKIFGMTRYYRGHRTLQQIYSGRVRTYQGMITQFEYDPSSGTVRTEDQDIQRDNHSRGSAQAETYPERSNSNPSYTRENTQAATEPQEARPSSAPVASPVPAGDLTTLTDAKMSKLKSKADGKSNDTEKLNAIKEGLKNEKLSTYQVSEIMDWLSFENSKVAFAKWAYDKTSDREYYSDLNQKISNQAYQDELTEFIKLKR
jgi:hypothetical protein